VSLPIDPDLDAGQAATRSPFDEARPARWPTLPPDVLVAVFAGGCLGGWARYGITSAWPAHSGRFPWATLSVNTAGAFVLAMVIVVAADVVSSRDLRPLLGTGFCGALTTFSTFQLELVDMLRAGNDGLAIAYAGASVAAGFATVALASSLTRRVRTVV
jgi:CrcB protein